MRSDTSTNFPPAGQPKEDPKKMLGKTMQELTDEKDKELAAKEKKGGDENIKHAKPGKSDILP
jgi:hypothetical protein